MNRLLVALIGAGFWAGCGGSESAPTTTSPSSDAASDTSTTGAGGAGGNAAPSEAGIDLDGFPIPDGPIGVCAVCIRDMCQSDLATCATDPKCQMGVICSIQKCSQYAGGDSGAEGLACLISCFGD